MNRIFLLETAKLTRKQKKSQWAAQFAFFTNYCHSDGVKRRDKRKNVECVVKMQNW
jgi:hypothetical protein